MVTFIFLSEDVNDPPDGFIVVLTVPADTGGIASGLFSLQLEMKRNVKTTTGNNLFIII